MTTWIDSRFDSLSLFSPARASSSSGLQLAPFIFFRPHPPSLPPSSSPFLPFHLLFASSTLSHLPRTDRPRPTRARNTSITRPPSLRLGLLKPLPAVDCAHQLILRPPRHFGPESRLVLQVAPLHFRRLPLHLRRNSVGVQPLLPAELKCGLTT